MVEDISTQLRNAAAVDPHTGKGCDHVSVDKALLLDAANVIAELCMETEKYRRAAFLIGETCVEESKWHISAEEAISKIRQCLYYPTKGNLL